MLPGFELSDVVAKSDSLEDLSAEKQYTAERLLVSHPDRYNIARGLFFEVGLSKRAICELCKLNSRTLNALIERELNSRGADFLYERIRRKKAVIAYQLTEQLEDLAQDPKACKQAGINGLLQAIKLIQESNGKTIDAESTSSNDFDGSEAEVDYVSAYKSLDLKPNGLDLKKNSAPRDQADSSVETRSAAEVESTPAAPSSVNRSILLAYGSVV